MTIAQIITEIENSPLESGGHIYHPIPFKEFDHLSTSSRTKGVYNKWAVIEKTVIELCPEPSQILDIGANGGFYTFNLAKLGHAVTAFESDNRYSKIAKTIISEKELPITWYDHGYTIENTKQEQRYRVALMLSVYQWMNKNGESQQYADDSLMYISKQSDFLIFELGFNHGKSCIRTSAINQYAYLIDFLKERTCYEYFKFMKKTRIWGGYSRFLVLCSNSEAYNDKGWRNLQRKLNF